LLICESNERLNKPVKIHLSLRVPKPFSEIRKSKDFKKIMRYFNESDIHFFDELYDSWGGRIKESDLPSGYEIYKNKFDMTKEPCYELFRRINVLYDGKVNFCVCRDLNADLIIGNIMEKHLINIWRGAELANLRNRWLNGDVPDICQECSRYLPVSIFYKKHYSYIVSTYLMHKFQSKIRDKGFNA
jgi:hypothetical protein